MSFRRLPSIRLAFPLRVAVLTLIGFAGVAQAASPEAWNELAGASEAACVKAARLNDAKAGAPIDFQGAVLRIVEGRYPQPHMNNKAGRVFCLYDKQSGRAEIAQPPR